MQLRPISRILACLRLLFPYVVYTMYIYDVVIGLWRFWSYIFLITELLKRGWDDCPCLSHLCRCHVTVLMGSRITDCTQFFCPSVRPSVWLSVIFLQSVHDSEIKKTLKSPKLIVRWPDWADLSHKRHKPRYISDERIHVVVSFLRRDAMRSAAHVPSCGIRLPCSCVVSKPVNVFSDFFYTI